MRWNRAAGKARTKARDVKRASHCVSGVAVAGGAWGAAV